MVIFIDDLDRCLPAVALQVLEALKLYLNIDDLIFVVGVDRVVIDQLIQKLYGDIGLEADKSRYYLAKMFQVEVTIGPTELQAEGFLDKQLGAIGAHTNQYWASRLGEDERRLIRSIVLRLAQRNPREIKRLINSVLIHGAGVLHVPGEPFTVAQGMQVYLVRRILDERYIMGLTVDTQAGMEFFHRWSEIVRSGAEPTVPDPEEMSAALDGQGPGYSHRSLQELLNTPYGELLRDQRFAHLRKLLADADLGKLMKIGYPADTSLLAEASPYDLPRGLLREAIARQRGKPAVSLTAADYAEVTQLDLEGQEIVDLLPLQALVHLRSLDLSFTQVADLGPLRVLRELETLVLANTQVKDLTPLRELTRLCSLSLANTPVTELAPIAELGSLRQLVLRGARIHDVTPLAGLSGLESLDLRGCPVSADAVDALRNALPGTDIHHG